ncbi:MAG TPA: O-antigen ligase family protein [Noviherbaspirillum sp.]|nr:O-antigen ligase family protein [Noviherbaspirillum sp.]
MQDSEARRARPVLYYGSRAVPRATTALLWNGYRTYIGVVLSLFLLVLFLNLPNYGIALNASLPPKLWYFAFVLLLAPLFFQTRALLFYLFSPFALWALAYVLINLIHLLGGVSGGEVARDAAILTRIQFVVLAVALGFALWSWRDFGYDGIFRAVAVLAPVVVILDFLVPGLFYPPGTPGTVPGRASATFINPTIAGEVILITFLFACPSVSMRYRMPLFLLTGLGAAMTFSRSAIVAWMVLWAFLQYRRVLPAAGYAYVLAFCAAIPFVLAALQGYLGSRADLDGAMGNLQDRISFFSNPSFNDESSQERYEALRAGLELFLQSPIEGAGAGATSSWLLAVGTHNQFILLAAEYGVVGIACWLAMARMLWTGKYFADRSLQIALVFLFVFLSMFAHTVFDMLYWLITFALVSDRTSPER